MGYMGILLIVTYPKPYSIYVRGTIWSSLCKLAKRDF